VLRVGLTGGIGSGKSEVARRLAAYGAVVIDADLLAHEAVAAGSDGLAEVVAAFGSAVCHADGTLDRQALGRLVFAEEPARRRLEAIIPQRVRAAAAAREEAARAGDPAAVVVHDIPLLVETGQADRFDVVLVVDAPDDLRVARLMAHRGMPEAQARARIAAQASREQRLAVADLVVCNNASLARLDEQVREVWADLAARAARVAR
jgi:dephospho-CoA kinase